MKKHNQFENLDMQKITISAKRKLIILALVNLFALIIRGSTFNAATILFMAVQFALMYVGVLTYVWRILFAVQAILATVLSVLLIMNLFTHGGNIVAGIINISLYAIAIPSAIMLYKDSDISYYLKYKWLFRK